MSHMSILADSGVIPIAAIVAPYAEDVGAPGKFTTWRVSASSRCGCTPRWRFVSQGIQKDSMPKQARPQQMDAPALMVQGLPA